MSPAAPATVPGLGCMLQAREEQLSHTNHAHTQAHTRAAARRTSRLGRMSRWSAAARLCVRPARRDDTKEVHGEFAGCVCICACASVHVHVHEEEGARMQPYGCRPPPHHEKSCLAQSGSCGGACTSSSTTHSLIYNLKD